MAKCPRRLTTLVAVLLQSALLFAQDAPPTKQGQPPGVGQAGDPYALYATEPVILHGPYLVAPSETSVVIAWTTDFPCHSKVLYGIGEPTTEATNPKEGLLPVGT